MKKIFFLAALMSASLMASAKQYCDEPLTLSGGAEIQLSCTSPSAGNYVITIKGENLNGLGGSFYNPGAVQLSTKITSSTSTQIVCEIEAESAPTLYTPLYVMCPGEQNIAWPNDIEWGTCGAAVKTNPELSLNQTEVTLSAEAPAETFQIVPTQSGDGAISYESSNAGIASVSDDGLVTAVGRGTAVISVKVAETETYAAATKKLTVTVTGPINWAGVAWLGGSNEKYKLVVTPEIADTYGGKHVENNSLWIGFPSADFGAMSIEPNAGDGAWKTFALSNFPNKENQFTVVCAGTTYTFDVFYVDGNDTTTAISNVNVSKKAYKMVENGVVYIIRDGVRYNVLGTKL